VIPHVAGSRLEAEQDGSRLIYTGRYTVELWLDYCFKRAVAIRVVLADDHRLVLHALTHLLERTPDVTVLGTCANATEAVEQTRRLTPDVLVLDVRMPGQNVFDAIRELRRGRSAVPIVLLTSCVTEQELVEALVLDVRGIVYKDQPLETLLDCLRKVARGGRWLNDTPNSTAAEVERRTTARESPVLLTPREAEVLEMVYRGLGNRDIATRMGISHGTVKIHLHHIFEKLQVRGRIEMLAAARHSGLI
jgi:DNA-binding NarL/FixJ family response regulator